VIYKLQKHTKTAKEIYRQGRNSVFENIPHPTSRIVDGHDYVRIKDILKQSLDLDVEILWTYLPDDSSLNV
jgi:hypothetical protein